MKVVLLASVKGLGIKGVIKEVSDGYYRNFLAPRSLAAPATVSQVKRVQHQQAKATEKLENMKESAQSIQNKLKGKTLELHGKAGDNGKLYAALHEKDCVKALKEQLHLDIQGKNIKLSEPMKETGTFTATVHLYQDISAELSIHVSAD